MTGRFRLLVFGILLATLFAPTVLFGACLDPIFTGWSYYKTSRGVGAEVVGDYNEDGLDDVIALLYDQPSYVVMLGGIHGRLSEQPPQPLPGGGRSAIKGDFDADGNLDAAFLTFAGSLAIVRGHGDGSFDSPQVLIADTAIAVAAGDVDGDGKSDVVFQTLYGIEAVTDPLFSPQRVQLSPAVGPAVVGDVDQDGDADVVVGDLGGELLRNLGNLQFRREPLFSSTLDSLVLIRDIDRDSKADMLFVGENKIFFGSDSEEWNIVNLPPGPATSIDAEVIDVDRDGSLDIVAIGFHVRTFRQLTGRTFTFTENPNARSSPTALRVADVNGDGYPDLVMSDASLPWGGVMVSLAGEDGVLQYDVALFNSALAWDAVFGDFDQDGRRDFAATSSNWDMQEGELSVFRQGADGKFVRTASLGDGTPVESVVKGDFNEDGWIDLASSGSSQRAMISLGSENGFTSSFIGFARNVSLLYAGDVNGDGHVDLLASGFGAASLREGLGDGTFGAERSLDPVYVVDLVDVDRDGDLDILTLWAKTMHCWKNDGSGAFTESWSLVNPDGREMWASATGDFNGDGNVDFIAGDSSGGIWAMAGRGDGTFSLASKLLWGRYPYDLELADVNGDSRQDLILPSAHFMDIATGNGEGAFVVTHRIGSTGEMVIADDFDQNGAVDLLSLGNHMVMPLRNLCSSVIVDSFAWRTTPSEGGDTYRVTGTGLRDGATVEVAQVSAETRTVAPGELEFVTPSGLPAGSFANVRVVNRNGSYDDSPSKIFVHFSDIPRGTTLFPFVEKLVRARLTAGCGGGAFCPSRPLTRAESAIFLVEAKYGAGTPLPPATGSVFADVAAASFGARWIEQLWRDGVTAGCGGGNYCPSAKVTRGEFAVLLGASRYDSASVPSAMGMFSDVPATHPFAKWVEKLATEGVVAGCGGGRFCPADNATRGATAVMVSTAFALP